MNNKAINFWLFLMGFLSLVRVRLVGMIGIAEIPCIIFGIVFFFQDYEKLRRDGFLPLCWWWLLTCVGSVVAPILWRSPFSVVIRGLAHPLTVFGGVVVIYHLTRNNIDAIRWFILGWSLSGVATYLVHGGNLVTLMEDGSDESAAILRMYLFAPLVLVPVRCWFTKYPIGLSIISLLGYGLYIAAASSSGRSAALGILAGVVLLAIGRKSVRKMASIRKSFVFYLLWGIVFVFAAKVAYSHAAAAGYLGEKSREKYERQSRGGDSLLRLLMSGRMQFFSGLYSAIQRPILGYGAWAIDYDDIYSDFIEKYGSTDDVEEYWRNREHNPGRVGMIDSHSHIIGFWHSAGISGLILWLYILHLIIQFFRKYIDVIPQWYGLFATLLPPFLWDIFFSPLLHRLEVAALLCALLYVRSVAQGRRQLSLQMVCERQKYLP